MRIRIEGSDLPGRRSGVEAERLRAEQVRVGVQHRADVVDLVPVDAEGASWELEVTSRESDGGVDVGGPWVHGKRGARFLYLSWGAGAEFHMFRRAKLMFDDIPPDLLRTAHEDGGVLVARLGLTDAKDGPVCARVRPPAITWIVE